LFRRWPYLLLRDRYAEKLKVAEAQGVETGLIQPGPGAADICREVGYLDIEVRALIEAIYPLPRFGEAWHDAGRRGTLKVLVFFA
jgi:hypothetical protein